MCGSQLNYRSCVALKCAKRALTPVLGLCVVVASLATAIWLVSFQVHVPGLSLPFGLFVFSFVAALLTADSALALCRRVKSHCCTSNAALVEQATPAPAVAWHSLAVSEAVAAWGLDASVVHAGLSHSDATNRLSVYGENRLTVVFTRRLWEALLKEVVRRFFVFRKPCKSHELGTQLPCRCMSHSKFFFWLLRCCMH